MFAKSRLGPAPRTYLPKGDGGGVGREASVKPAGAHERPSGERATGKGACKGLRAGQGWAPAHFPVRDYLIQRHLVCTSKGWALPGCHSEAGPETCMGIG